MKGQIERALIGIVRAAFVNHEHGTPDRAKTCLCAACAGCKYLILDIARTGVRDIAMHMDELDRGTYRMGVDLFLNWSTPYVCCKLFDIKGGDAGSYPWFASAVRDVLRHEGIYRGDMIFD